MCTSCVQNDLNVSEWYLDIPPITRAYFTLSFLLTAATALDLISPFSLYLNLQLVFDKGEVSSPCALVIVHGGGAAVAAAASLSRCPMVLTATSSPLLRPPHCRAPRPLPSLLSPLSCSVCHLTAVP